MIESGLACIALGDLTGNGRAEVFLLDNTGNSLRIYSSRSEEPDL